MTPFSTRSMPPRISADMTMDAVVSAAGPAPTIPFATIAANHGSTLDAFRMARPDMAHLRLANGEVLVVELDANDQVRRVYTPGDYARVDLTQTRDPGVYAKWDVHTGWDTTT